MLGGGKGGDDTDINKDSRGVNQVYYLELIVKTTGCKGRDKGPVTDKVGPRTVLSVPKLRDKAGGPRFICLSNRRNVRNSFSSEVFIVLLGYGI
jgi:hypothetical protein